MSRNADSKIQSYLRQVDAALVEATGVTFTAIQGDVEDAKGIRMVSEMNGGVSPQGFVDLLRRSFPLKSASDFPTTADAATFNVGAMALATFTNENRDWVQAPDGYAYRDSDGGVSRLAYTFDRSGKATGFAACHADGGVLDFDDAGQPVPPEASAFRPVAGASDIGDAVANLDQALESTYAAAPAAGMGMR